MGRLAGQRALITGAAGGLGAAMARAFAAEGAQLLLTDIDEAAAKALAGELGALACRLDVRDEADWRAALALAGATGGLSVLVNNAGIATGGTLEHLSLADWRAAFAVNVDGPFLGCKLGMELLAAGGGGAIINIASAAALEARPEMAAYGASKAALVHLTRSTALLGAPRGVRANAILPAFADTPMIDAMRRPTTPRSVLEARLAAQVPLGRIARPAEIAALAVYLASSESAFLTGAAVPLDGGATL